MGVGNVASKSETTSKNGLSPYQIKTIHSIETLSECRISQEEVVRRSFELIRATIAFHAAVFFFLDPQTGRIVGAVLDNIGSRYLLPLIRGMQTKRHSPAKGPIVRGSEVSARCVYREALLQKTVLEPNRLGKSLIGTVCGPDGAQIGQFCLWRKVGQQNFSRVDATFAQAIVSALGSALSVSRTGQGQTHNAQSLLTLVQRRSRPGILIVDEAGHVISSNREAADFIELLDTRDGASDLQSRSVPPDLLEMCRELWKHRNGREGGESAGQHSLMASHVYTFGGERFSMRGAILEAMSPGSRPQCLVLIERISLQEMKLGRVVAQLGLSPREVGVVREVIRGRTNKEVAQALGMTEHTVKAHLKRIMPKLGVSTRAGILPALVNRFDSGDGSGEDAGGG